MTQLVFLAVFPWAGLIIARLIVAWIQRPGPTSLENNAVLFQQIDMLRDRPLDERERLLDEIRHRLAD